MLFVFNMSNCHLKMLTVIHRIKIDHKLFKESTVAFHKGPFNKQTLKTTFFSAS